MPELTLKFDTVERKVATRRMPGPISRGDKPANCLELGSVTSPQQV